MPFKINALKNTLIQSSEPNKTISNFKVISLIDFNTGGEVARVEKVTTPSQVVEYTIFAKFGQSVARGKNLYDLMNELFEYEEYRKGSYLDEMTIIRALCVYYGLEELKNVFTYCYK